MRPCLFRISLLTTLLTSLALFSERLWGQNRPAPIAVASVPALIDEAVKYQLDDFHHTGWSLRYRVHRVDDKEDSIRELIESSDGNVARTLVRHGQPLTPEQDAAERRRLQSISAQGMGKHKHSAEETDKFGVELISAFSQAMNFTLTPEQPQMPEIERPQTVLDYKPNPQYRPSTKSQTLLAGIAGRVWVDAETHHLLRIEIHVTQNLDLLAGILVRVFPGGTLVYEQHAISGGHYAYSHIDINVRLRELMVHTVPYHSTLDATHASVLASVPTYKQAVDMLLEAPAPVSHTSADSTP